MMKNEHLHAKPQKSIVSLVHEKQISGTPARYDQRDLQKIDSMLRNALESIGGMESIIKSGDTVVIKPNATWPISADAGVTTDPRIIEAIVRLVKNDTGAKEVILAERTAVGRDTTESLKTTGILDAALRGGIDKIVPLEKESKIPVIIPRAKALIKPIYLPKLLFDADVLIYVPKMKTHKQTVVSLTMKLSQGILSYSDIIRSHRADLEQKLVDLLTVVKPDLSVIDGIYAMQGQGPGSPYEADLIKDRNLIVAGTDPVAVDSVAAATMGFEPMHDVGMIRGAILEGLGEGNLDNISVRGEAIKDVKRHFRRGTCSLVGLHPKIEIYCGGACIGCQGFTRTGLDPLLADEKLLEKVEKITVILGYKTEVPENIENRPPHSYVFVIGDCAKEHKDKGIFLPGCPSTGVHEIIRFLGEKEDEILRIFWKYQPRGFTP